MYQPTKSRYKYLNFTSKTTYRRFADADKNIKKAILNGFLDNIPDNVIYGELLLRPEWISKRAEILSRDFRSCVICKRSDSLQIHHRQYHFIVSENKFKLPWEYAENLLITLCDSCHKRGHTKFKVPIIKI